MYSTPLCLTHSCDRSIVRETARPGEDASQVLKCYLALYSPNSTAYSLDEAADGGRGQRAPAPGGPAEEL